MHRTAAAAPRDACTTPRRPMLATLIACTLATASCGGGDDDATAPPLTASASFDLDAAGLPSTHGTTASSATAARTKSQASEAASASEAMAKPVAVIAATDTPSASADSAASAAPATFIKRPTPAAAQPTLATPSREPERGLRAVARTALCPQGFVAPADLQRNEPAPLPTAGGVFFTSTELASWRARVKNGPFVNAGDFSASSPGDWARISANAARFAAAGDALTSDDESTRSRHGQLARDAAFTHLMQPDARLLASVRTWLLQQAEARNNDFASQRCYTDAGGTSRDGFFAEAPWLARFVATYDFVRAALPNAERVRVENYIRRNAWFFATHLDWGLREVFPRRMAGDYAARGSSAAATGAERWWMRRVYSQGSCNAEWRDDARSFPAYTHVRADGSWGNQVPVLAVWFNNRRAANALAAGAAGVLLGDADLVERARRYTQEWLTYGVFADGSASEYFRNGEYCVARQGLIYGSHNVQSALMLGRLLERQGDRSLVDFQTRDGLFGTEAAADAEPKSLSLAARTLLEAATGALNWYQAESERTTQQPREATALARNRIHYLASSPMDSFHELSLLSSAAAVPRVAVAATLLRHPLITRSAASAAGVTVETGLGSWTDALGILPAAYLLRP